MIMRFKTRVQKQGERLKAEIPDSIRDNFKPGETIYIIKEDAKDGRKKESKANIKE
jgi:hypothetical protein